MYLAGDIGGTQTRLAAWEENRGQTVPAFSHKFPTSESTDTPCVLRTFLGQAGIAPDRVSKAVFAVAGRVSEASATLTSSGRVIKASEIRKVLPAAEIRMVTDIQAWAMALPGMPPEDLQVLNAGSAADRGVKACLAPGTGLGQGFLIPGDRRWIPCPSEGGHGDFAPVTREQQRLLAFLFDTHDHVSYERICSGPGISMLYAFHKETAEAQEPAWLRAELAGAPDPVPVIVKHGLGDDPEAGLCRLALDTFCRVLGAEAGNLALRVMATGGIYLCGGIPSRILPALERGGFMAAFRRKGRMTEFLERIPVVAVTNRQAALQGARALINLPDRN